MADFNPYLQTELRDVKAQGANVGDVRNYNGSNFRWSGVNWEPSGGGSSSSSLSMSSGPIASSPTFNSDDLNKAIANSVSQYKTAIQPAVDTLQSRVDPLKSRYNDLLASIKGQGETAVNRQTTVTNNELGKRGILGSSGVAQQEIVNATEPVRQQYAGLVANTGLAQEKDLNDIATAIANLQSGAATQGITTGSSLYGNAVSSAASQAQQQIANQIAQKQLENATKQTNYDINKPYSTSSSSSGPDLSSLFGILGGLTENKSSGQWVNSQGKIWTDTTKTPVGTFIGRDGKTYTQYSDGSSGPTVWTFK